MRFLFVHQNFPGQYIHIVRALASDPANEIVALGLNESPAPKGIRIIRYPINRSSSKNIHSLVSDFEAKVIRGEAAARAAKALMKEGFRPDIICAHPGWGEMLFMRDIWPDVPILSYFEFYYSAKNQDTGFDPEFPVLDEQKTWGLRTKNAAGLLSLSESDWLVTPTKWQRQQLPPQFNDRISVIHDGIDTQRVRPRDTKIKLGKPNSGIKEYGPADEVVTFINRNLEPYRGYHIFMRALPHILAARPRARAVIVGGDRVSYGASAPAGQSWKSIFLNEVQAKLDMSRVHFVGNIPYSVYLDLLSVSAVHIYLTYPFVLSWSMLEAMSAQCLVIGSNTPPVAEVLQHEQNVLLVDFFSPDEIAATAIEALAHPKKFLDLRIAARKTALQYYDLNTVCLPRHLELIRKVADGLVGPLMLAETAGATNAADTLG